MAAQQPGLTPMDLGRYYMRRMAMRVDTEHFQELCWPGPLELHSYSTIRTFQPFVAGPLQCLPQHTAHWSVIIDDQNACNDFHSPIVLPLSHVYYYGYHWALR